MHDSVLLVSIILLYLLSGEKMTRPVLAVLLLLMVFFLTSPTWITSCKEVIVVSSFCLLVMSRCSITLLLLVTLSSLLLVCSSDWLSIYLALELQALGLFVLAGLRRDSAWSTEAGLKYFALGALSSSFFLLGSALFYGVTGDTHLQSIGGDLGKLFITIALLFKLSAAPFHMWAPDVYEGAPSSTTAILAVVPKVSVFSIMAQVEPAPHLILACAFLSVVVGALGALNQTRFKRLVAYSGVGHIGFTLFGLSLNTIEGLQASFVYLSIYAVMSLCIFSTFISLRPRGDFVWGFSAASRENPGMALVLALVFLSMAGVPPLAGFMGKFLVLLAGLSSGYFQVSLVVVIFSIVAAFYYVRLVQLIYFPIDFSVILWQRVLMQRGTVYWGLALLVGATFYLVLLLLAHPSLLLQFGYWAALGFC